MQPRPASLRDALICTDLSPADLADVERVARLKRLARGETISFGEVERDALLILTEGRVIIVRIHEDGRRIIVAGLYPGMAIVNTSVISSGVSSGVAEALRESYLHIIVRADLDRLIEAKPKFALRVVELLRRRAAFLEERLEMQAFEPISTRLAALLVGLSSYGRELRVSHRRLAESVGASREAVTRVLDDFQAKGLVDLSRLRFVRIVDPEGLALVAGRLLPQTEEAKNKI